jgi:Type IV secretion system pilin
VTDILLFTIPLIAAVSLLIAGYLYIFSAGDSEKATKAKTIIKWNVIAILVAFLSYGIVSIVASFFGT